jgi:O-antigen/teichoic acid export membrane protein
MFSMLVSLYTARIILNTLGVEDYGIYNVVNGVMIMFGFLNAAMATGTQRFLTFELGIGDRIKLNRVFSMSLNVHVIVALIVVILAETLGLWFLNAKLVIPEGRMVAANWVYQLSVFSAMISITQVPYSASIISHEKFNIYAFVGLADVFLRLIVVFVLVSLRSFDKLILLATLSALVSAGIAFYYRFYCKTNFQECTYNYFWDKFLFKSLFSFSGWSLLGNTSHILMTQGMNILINLFFGVSVNAARAVTIQVEGAINSFVKNFTTAIDPQITKNYAAGNLDALKQLLYRGSKFSFLILFIFTLPVYLELEWILSTWLQHVPDYTIIFIRINLIVSLVYSLTYSYLTAIFATGKIRKYQSFVAVSVFLMFGLTYYLLNKGFPPETTYYIYFIISVLVFIYRITSVSTLIGFSFYDYSINVLLRILIIFILSIPIPLLVIAYLETSLYRVIAVFSISIAIIGALTFIVGFDSHERKFITEKVKIIFKV